jgi:hypothetical protein
MMINENITLFIGGRQQGAGVVREKGDDIQ